MNTPSEASQIPPLELLDKVEEDALGCVHCATWKPGEEREEVVLARLFEPGSVDLECFLETTAERQRLLEDCSSHFVITSRRHQINDNQAVDVLPYVSGSSLGSLIRSAIKRRESIPAEIALSIVGRIGAGLSSVYRMRGGGDEVLHGFVIPQLIRVSEEGQVMVSGFEVAPALRELRGTVSNLAEILPYLSPESLPGRDLHPTDDVYSLGVILFELLTLRPLASPTDLRFESARIPSPLRYFLSRSVAPRSCRIASVLQWVQELKTLIIEEGWTASSAQVSAYLATLDESRRPMKPDTSEITASDRRAFAAAIRSARGAQSRVSKSAVSKSAVSKSGASKSGASGTSTKATSCRSNPKDSSRRKNSGCTGSSETGTYQTMPVSSGILAEKPSTDSAIDIRIEREPKA